MPITSATLDHVSLKVPKAGGLVLPEPVRRVVVRPLAQDRVVRGLDTERHRVTQARFNFAVGSIWTDFAPRSRAILAGRLLNPRVPLSPEQFDVSVRASGDYFDATEGAAIDILTSGLKALGIDIERGRVTNAQQEHLYFIPVPEKNVTSFVDAKGHAVTRDYLEQAIRYGFGQGGISDLQALFLLNAHVSAFRLTVDELSQLVGLNLSHSLESDALYVAAGLLGSLGLRPAK